MDKKILNMINEEKIKRFKQRQQQNNTEKYKIIISECTTSESISEKKVEDLENTISKNKLRLNKPTHRKNTSSIKREERKRNANKIGRKKRTKLDHSTLQVKKKFYRVMNNKNINFTNVKEIIENFYKQIDKSSQIMNAETSVQSNYVQEKIKQRKMGVQKMFLRTNSVANQNHKKMKRHQKSTKVAVAHKRMISEGDQFSATINSFKLKKNFFNSLLTGLDNHPKKGRKLLSLNQEFDKYLSSLHDFYMDKFFEIIYNKALNTIKEYFKNKFELYLKYEDQVKEFDYVFGDDFKSSYNKSIELMVNNLLLEREKDFLSLLNETNNKLKVYFDKNLKLDINYSEEIGNCGEILINNLINIPK